MYETPMNAEFWEAQYPQPQPCKQRGCFCDLNHSHTSCKGTLTME